MIEVVTTATAEVAPNLYSTTSLYDVKFACWNVQGLITKIDAIHCLVSDFNLTVICVVEHWLSSEAITQFKIGKYKLKAYYGRSANIHGGCAILLKDSIKGKLLITI